VEFLSNLLRCGISRRKHRRNTNYGNKTGIEQMPTGGKLVAAMAFAALAYFVTDLVKPLW